MIQLLINESEYKVGLFLTIPSRIPEQDTLLIRTDGTPRLVDDTLTIRDIRSGNFNKIARVSTSLFTLDIVVKATSKTVPYQFDVAVSVDCRVSNSVAYYMAKSTYDIEGSLNTALSRVITQEAKKFELTEDNINDGILQKLQEKEKYLLEPLGITYTVVSVEAKPDSDAERNFIKKMTDQKLNVMVEQNRRVETGKLTSRNMEEAIIGQVADGKIDMKTALEQLSNANRSEGYNKLEGIERLIDLVRKLQTDNLISDDEAGQRINEFLRTLPTNLPNESNEAKELSDAEDFTKVGKSKELRNKYVIKNGGTIETQKVINIDTMIGDISFDYIDNPKIDEVQFIAAPDVFIKGSKALVNIYMFEELFKHLVEDDIKNDKLLNITTSGFLKIENNTRVYIILESQDAEIEDNIAEVIWCGRFSKFSYDVFLPRDSDKTQIVFCGKIYFNQTLVTKIKFIAQVSTKSKQKLKIDKVNAKSAFISYASQDRPKVAARIQGMIKMAPNLDIFFDIKSLRSGQEWENILWEEIKKRDIFFLFWSQYAKASEYVTKEWQYALKEKGADAIEPVPLESPDVCPPPIELKNKHFNDWMLMYT